MYNSLRRCTLEQAPGHVEVCVGGEGRWLHGPAWTGLEAEL